MNKNIFISHSSVDKNSVKVLGDLIERVSLRQIHIWFSNDTERNGGFLVGEDWFVSILNNIKRSQAVISFITPNSNNQPWILYESGYAEALNCCTLIPVKISVNIKDISTPLQHKQIFNLSNKEDLHIFLDKLLHLFNMNYDKEAFQEIVESSLKIMKDTLNIANNPKNDSELSLEKIEQKIDYYFESFFKDKNIHDKNKYDCYDIIVSYSVGKKENKDYVSIKHTATVKDVLDAIYYLICDIVEPYMYLKTWVLIEEKTKRIAIVSADIYDWLPAQSLFKINSLWKVLYLDKPLLIDM